MGLAANLGTLMVGWQHVQLVLAVSFLHRQLFSSREKDWLRITNPELTAGKVSQLEQFKEALLVLGSTKDAQSWHTERVSFD